MSEQLPEKDSKDRERYNRILRALPQKEVKLLQPHLEAVDMTYRMDLGRPNSPIDHIYFVHYGVASLMSPLENGFPVEVATVGPEGMVGIAVLLGDDTVPYRAFIQVPGKGLKMSAGEFRRALKSCPALHRILLRYALALMNQMAQNAACNRAHPVDQRCARWLLMSQDRVMEPSFQLTQEFMAQMLGVRRPTVSIAAGMLAREGLISYIRGQITILDRKRLEAAACECYRIIRNEFERLVEQ
jgi:CRP-like cAMP-binding protein